MKTINYFFIIIIIGDFILWLFWIITLNSFLYHFIEVFTVVSIFLLLGGVFFLKLKLSFSILLSIQIIICGCIYFLNTLVFINIDNESDINLETVKIYFPNGNVFFKQDNFKKNEAKWIIELKKNMGGYFKLEVKNNGQMERCNPYFIGSGNAQPHFDTLTIGKNLKVIQYWRVMKYPTI